MRTSIFAGLPGSLGSLVKREQGLVFYGEGTKSDFRDVAIRATPGLLRASRSTTMPSMTEHNRT